MTIFEVKEQGRLEQAQRITEIPGLKVATSVYNSSDVVRILGFSDEVKRENLIYSTLQDSQPKSQSFILENNKMSDKSWTGIGSFKTTDAEKQEHTTFVVYQEAGGLTQGSTFVNFLTGEIPNTYLSSVDLKTAIPEIQAIQQIKVSTEATETRAIVVFIGEGVLKTSDCLVTADFSVENEITKFDFKIDNCDSVNISDMRIPESNAAIYFLNNLSPVVYDDSTKNFQFCTYDQKNRKVYDCKRSLRAVNTDSVKAETEVFIQENDSEVQISLLDRDTKRPLLTIHNIQESDFDTYQDISAYSVVSWPGNLLTMTQTTSTLRTVNDEGIFSVEIYAEKNDDNIVHGIVNYSDKLASGELVNINLILDYTVINPVKDFKLLDLSVKMPDFDILTNDSQILNVGRDNFKGNDLDFTFFSDQSSFDIFNYEDLKLELNWIEGTKLSDNLVLKKMHIPYGNNIIGEYLT